MSKDISKCEGGDCPLRNSCLRYTMSGTEYQSYIMIPPYEGMKCKFYIDNGNGTGDKKNGSTVETISNTQE